MGYQIRPVIKVLDMDADLKKAELSYKYILQVRDLDNQLMWTRIRVVLIVQGALLSFLAASYNSLAGKYNEILILIEICDVVSAVLLYFITRGGSWWVHHWEEKLNAIEKSDARIDYGVFGADHPAFCSPEKHKELYAKGYVSTKKIMINFTCILIAIWLIILVFTVHGMTRIING